MRYGRPPAGCRGRDLCEPLGPARRPHPFRRRCRWRLCAGGRHAQATVMTGPGIPFLDGLDVEAVAAVRAAHGPVRWPEAARCSRRARPGTRSTPWFRCHRDFRRCHHGLAPSNRPPSSARKFGEMALLSTAPRSATATALRDSSLLRLTRADFEEVVEHHPRMPLYFARLLTERMRAVQAGEGSATHHAASPCSP